MGYVFIFWFFYKKNPEKTKVKRQEIKYYAIAFINVTNVKLIKRNKQRVF